MKRVITGLILSCLLLCSLPAVAVDFSGYISGMPSLIVQHPQETWWQFLAHNRLNLEWRMTEHLRIDAGARNRLITGSEIMIDPKGIGSDMGWVDLSWNWAHGKNAVANTSFDRLHLTFEKNKWKLQTGRQRINWGQTFVWNPNDIFNTHSFFDFDYPERSGCDSFRGTYYHSATSFSELAVSVNHENKITAALLHRWNWLNVDYQLIAGELAETDLVFGGAVTSDFGGLNLRSEISYFHPIEKSTDTELTDTSKVIAVSVGADYMFSNSLMLQTEILYNNVNNDFSEDGLMNLYLAPLSAKYLSICNWNIFAQASYPITPRLNGSLSGMYFVDVQTAYAGISLDYSIIENLDFSFITQYFSTFGDSELGNMKVLQGFMRVKYSF